MDKTEEISDETANADARKEPIADAPDIDIDGNPILKKKKEPTMLQRAMGMCTP